MPRPCSSLRRMGGGTSTWIRTKKYILSSYSYHHKKYKILTNKKKITYFYFT